MVPAALAPERVACEALGCKPNLHQPIREEGNFVVPPTRPRPQAATRKLHGREMTVCPDLSAFDLSLPAQHLNLVGWKTTFPANAREARLRLQRTVTKKAGEVTRL
eukprot:scaffold2790_cov239-Pinguiococcus_pyrenoidosus.AAC.1